MAAPPVLLFQNVAGQVLADPAGFLRLTWSAQPRQLADTQALFGAVAQGLRQRQWSRVLSDQSARSPLTADEVQWLGQVWLPGEGRASGYRCGAIVLAADVLSRLATATITTDPNHPWLRYRSFDTVEAAAAWLVTNDK